eukprot:scaffold91437_cov21-Tisochrysis_lutea.AAC.2
MGKETKGAIVTQASKGMAHPVHVAELGINKPGAAGSAADYYRKCEPEAAWSTSLRERAVDGTRHQLSEGSSRAVTYVQIKVG